MLQTLPSNLNHPNIPNQGCTANPLTAPLPTHLSSQSFTEKMNVTVCLLQMGKLRLRLLLSQEMTVGLGESKQGCTSLLEPVALDIKEHVLPSASCAAV